MSTPFDRIYAKEAAAKATGKMMKKLRATAEESNEEAFNFFLKKVSFFLKDNGDVTVNKFDCSVIVVFFFCQFFFQ